MTLQQLIHFMQAEGAHHLTLYANGSAQLYKGASLFDFDTLAELEKSFSSSPSSSTPPDACTCDQSTALLRDTLDWLNKFHSGDDEHCTGCQLKHKLNQFLNPS